MKLFTKNNKHTLVLIAVLVGLAGYSQAALFQRNGGPHSTINYAHSILTWSWATAPAWHNWDNSQLERWLTDHKVPNPGPFLPQLLIIKWRRGRQIDGV